MKIFWSWQSDTRGRIGRHFVRDAILGAIQDLKTPPDVEEPTEGVDRDALHLDSDRQGVTGSPDLAATIFAKIDAAAVVIADVTPVGCGPGRQGEDGVDLPGRALMNPNVAIELGYALGKPSKGAGNRLLMVCNAHFGTRSDLPFDLAHKAGPIFFDLAPSASRATIEAEQTKLRRDLVTSLRPFLGTVEAAAAPALMPTPRGSNAGVWFKSGDWLGQSGDLRFDNTLQDHVIPDSPVFYLRLVPSRPLVTPLTRSEIRNIANNLPYFSMTGGFYIFENLWGSACLELQGGTAPLASAVQLFLNGEIWAINHVLVARFQDQKLFSYAAVEEILKFRVPQLIEVLTGSVGASPPLVLEAGFVGIDGYRMSLDQLTSAGPIHQTPNPVRLTLNADTLAARSELLLNLFEKMFFDLVQERRPENYREFPLRS